MKRFFRVQSHQACPGQFKGHTLVLQVTYVIVPNKKEYSNNTFKYMDVCILSPFFVNKMIDYYANYANFNWYVNILIILHILTYVSE